MKKPNITPGEWTQSRYAKGNVVSMMPNGTERSVASCMGYSTNTGDGAHVEENLNNSELVIIAGNLTNKNFRIEAIEEMYEALGSVSEVLNIFAVKLGIHVHGSPVKNDAEDDHNCFHVLEKAKQALKNAKYEQ